MDCFVSPLPLRAPGLDDRDDLGPLTSHFRFVLRATNDAEPVLAAIAPARPASMARPYLASVTESGSSATQFQSASSELRQMVGGARTPLALAALCEKVGQRAAADQLREAASRERLARSRVRAHASRRILRALLGRMPINEDLQLLQRGIGVCACP